MSIEETRKRRAAKAQEPQAQQSAPLDMKAVQEMIHEAVQSALQPIRLELERLCDEMQSIQDQEPEDQIDEEENNEPQDQEPENEKEADQANDLGDEEEVEPVAENQEEPELQRQPRPESPVQRLREGPPAILLGGSNATAAGRVWRERVQQKGGRSHAG